ncbi:MAG: N-acetyl sugar amidotransferase [Pseudomonadota bacterium]|nr:N-acetyl sugar amidotransferase [Pseudomonadota bacterium]
MRYCSNCVFPAVAATPLTFDENGVCSGCRSSIAKHETDWEHRLTLFKQLCDEYRTNDNYDCVLPVSGGKDSYFAAHVCKELGMNALMVTYHGNNYLPEGEDNLNQMKDVFGFDHIIFRPSTDTLIRLNRAGFIHTGDMNWHCHAGIFTYPMQIAVKYRIPLVFWGDHGFSEQGGMYSLSDFFEYTKKDRYENCLHGFDWFDFENKEGLTRKQLQFLIYPDDEEVLDVGLRGIFLSNYFPYDGEHHAAIAEEHYKWKAAERDFERTFRKISNLDDMHENGIHDYMKFIKLGYGRGTDHSNYAIRDGKMTREEGIEMVKKYDHVKSSDLQRWLNYVGMEEAEFDLIADRFRDPRVWSKEGDFWVKDTIWGERKAYA